MDWTEMNDYVLGRLVCCWSPDQIAARSKSDFADDRRRQISGETIYAWIRSQPPNQRRLFARFLRRAGCRRPRDDRRGRMPGQVSIAARPKVVDARRRYGDWEGDTIVEARHAGSVVTLVERKSRYLLTAKSCDRNAWRVAGKIESRLSQLPRRLRRTATFECRLPLA